MEIRGLLLAADGVTVTSVRNKGSIGGSLEQNPHPSSVTGTKCALPKLATEGINGLPALEFDWNSALAMSCPLASVVPRQFYVFGAFQRLQFGESGHGNYAAPFSCYALDETSADQSGTSGFHYEEKASTIGFSSSGYTGWTEISQAPDPTQPYVLSIYQQTADYVYAQEYVTQGDPSTSTNYVWTGNTTGSSATLDVTNFAKGANLFRYGTYAAPDKWALVGPRAKHRLVTNNPSLKLLQLQGTGFFVIAR